MIFVYFLIVSHVDALVVRFNKCSRLQGFETKGGTWAAVRFVGPGTGVWQHGSGVRLFGQTRGPWRIPTSPQASAQTLPTPAVCRQEHLQVSSDSGK